jgi:hypothetical protein
MLANQPATNPTTIHARIPIVLRFLSAGHPDRDPGPISRRCPGQISFSRLLLCRIGANLPSAQPLELGVTKEPPAGRLLLFAACLLV